MMDSPQVEELPVSGTESRDPADWVRAHGDMLFRFALARIGRREIAEELVQDTFLAAIRSADGFEGRSKVSTWLTGILKNKVIDYLRRNARREEPTAEPPDPAEYGDNFNRIGIWNRILGDWAAKPDEILEGKHFSQVLTSCIAKLPVQPRRAFMLKSVDGLEADEVCKVMNITSTNFWVMMHRARMALRDCIENNWVNAQ